jgi:dienelactone hydrolase
VRCARRDPAKRNGGEQLKAEWTLGIESIAGPEDEFLQYADLESVDSCLKALYDLETLVDEEGPFDGVIGFSLGATLAASLMAHKLRKNPQKERLHPTFRCAIFFCGGVPEIFSMEDCADRRLLSYETDGELIEIPTAHIWGANDHLWPTFGAVLSKLCRQDQRAIFIHPGGHEIPGPKDQDSLLQAIRVIKRTVERADQRQ